VGEERRASVTTRGLESFLSRRIEAWLARRKLGVIHFIQSGAVGETFLITAYMRLLQARYGLRFIVITKYPELFLHNPCVRWNVPFNRLGFIRKPLVKWFTRNVQGAHIIRFGYRPLETVTPGENLADHCRRVSLLQLCTEHHEAFPIAYGEFQNQMLFSARERAASSARFGLSGAYAVIKPKAKAAWTPNKEWVQERFQEVVGLMPEVAWVQVGEAEDPPLSGVVDLRGKTSLRELCFLVSRAKWVLAPEGFYNHAASAFGTPSFVIFSGLTHPELAWYSNTIPILRKPQVPCAPCWLTTPCPVAGKPCTNDISVEQVVATIRRHALGTDGPRAAGALEQASSSGSKQGSP
jgi:hypothetical protein